MVEASLISRQERFATVSSTNDVVREWLADGTPEICLAVADEQTAGRGREGRTWLAPQGGALLLSLGFRPTWLSPQHVWRLAATVSLAMADAAEEVAGLPDRAIRLKWPNDLVVETVEGAGDEPAGKTGGEAPAPERGRTGGEAPGPERGEIVRKLAGVLGETDGLGSDDPRVVIGIGVNADWAAADFPAEIAGAMTSLREASHGRPIDLALLLDAFLSRVEVRIEALRGGRFDVGDWIDRQLTNGRLVRLELPDGSARDVRALGVDPSSGGLVVEDRELPTGERIVYSGEIHHLRLSSAPAGV